MSDLLDYRLVRELQAKVADFQLDDRRGLQARGLPVRSAVDEQQQAQSFIRTVVAAHMDALLRSGQELPPDTSYEMRLRSAIYSAIYGAGELQELLEDDSVENIDINGCEQTWVTYAGGVKQLWRPVAATNEDLVSIVQNLGSYAGMNARPFSPTTPELDVRLQDGSRLSALMSATETPSVSIRRNRYPQMFLRPDIAAGATKPGTERPPDLVSLGTVTQEVADFLYAAVRSRCNIVVGGATDAGKTTLLRALINCIDPLERLLTIEKALELGLSRHPDLHVDVREMEEVLPDSEGRFAGLDIATLVRRSRRMNPSRVIVGEVLGPEVVEMLSAMAQGNDGSLSTIHARDASEVFNRIATYAVQNAMPSFEVAHSLMAGAIDFVVFVEKNPRMGLRRTVTEIIEVGGTMEGRVAQSRIFAPSKEDGRATRSHEIPIVRMERLTRASEFTDGLPAWSAPARQDAW
ncbi:CpaF family protein [Jatrophihabitans lederbergiae]|uniref:ATPase, T2SS/T4P/T4SS family n=1 Tax=Jatrophihabitans lederbergiae TaxID=3075547 RepID=A0ABU2JBC5_9ACTN|nr:ATPase, T2SS/T4P/T4SS family [Jatrophihabitans sp. DSM 44399]MDT0262285.1 ATPase, T2SS/T4P/T4SS family [Jatrophihabitans sp. DSM 44399]